MSAARGDTGLSPIEEAILEELRESRLDYVALIAGRRGLRVRQTRERCRDLAERGLIERVSDEVVYRITTAGERRLRDG